MLPEIKGPIKSVRMLLMQDLEADGVIKRNIPFSQSRSKAYPACYLIQIQVNKIFNDIFFCHHRGQESTTLKRYVD